MDRTTSATMDFSFVSDVHFRESRECDYRELISAQENGAWKSVHVLSGSIVEALLTDFLVISQVKHKGKDALTLTFSEAVEASHAAGLIEKETVSLCDVVRDYRNLIHPARMKRLAKSVSPESGNIAISLVAIIGREIARERAKTYGPTAEQIRKKLLNDGHVLSVLAQILAENKEYERVRLADHILPLLYANEDADPFTDASLLRRVRSAYRLCFDTLNDHEKGRLSLKFTKLIREESSEKIQAFGQCCFSASDLPHLPQQDRAMATSYLLSLLDQSGISIEASTAMLAGLSAHLTTEELAQFADSIVKSLLRQTKEGAKRLLIFAENEFLMASEDGEVVLDERASHWISTSNKNDFPPTMRERLEQLRDKWFYIPF